MYLFWERGNTPSLSLFFLLALFAFSFPSRIFFGLQHVPPKLFNFASLSHNIKYARRCEARTRFREFISPRFSAEPFLPPRSLLADTHKATREISAAAFGPQFFISGQFRSTWLLLIHYEFYMCCAHKPRTGNLVTAKRQEKHLQGSVRFFIKVAL